MATTRKYLGHLLQNTGITPACSEEERVAAEDIAAIFTAHGFEPEVQEFNASPTPRVMRAALGIGLFLGSVLMGIGGAVGIIGALVAIAMAVLYVLERMGKIALPSAGGAGVSQNVIAYHKAEGPLASPRNRPVVVVAHYDSPRADLFAGMPYATYRPIISKLMPYMMLVPAVIAVLRLFPFPPAAKIVLWILAIAAALVPLAYAVGVIANRYVLPYTSGSVCNKSSVAAMLGVMDAVAPYAGNDEFPQDVPFDEYFSEQVRIAEEEELAAAIAAGDLPEDAAATDEGEAASEPGDEEDALQGTASMSIDVDEASVDLGATAAISMEPVIAAAAAEIDADIHEEEDASEAPADDLSEAGEDDAPEEDVAGADDEPELVNAFGNYRFGEDAIRAIGMVPESCVIVYEDDEPEADEETPAPTEDSEDAEEAIEQVDAAPFDYGQESGKDSGEVFDEGDVYEEEPEDEGGFFPPAGQAGIAGALSAVGSGAARLFNGMKRRGKGVLESLGTHEHEDAEEEQPDELASDETDVPVASEDASLSKAMDSVPVDTLDETAAVEEGAEPALGETRSFEVPEVVATEPAGAQEIATPEPAATSASIPDAVPAQPVETVDSLMAQIATPRPQIPRVPQRTFNTVPDPSVPSISQVNASSRASLFDLPDPSSAVVDPFSAVSSVPDEVEVAEAMPSVPAMEPSVPQSAPSGFSVIGPNDIVEPAAYDAPAPAPGVFETISADAPIGAVPAAPERRRGFGKLFGKKKRQEESMSDWLGVDEGFDAKLSGRDIGSWDNFEGDDWKGGAAGADGVSVDELRDAVTSMGDDELLGHDIWFVATGASEFDNAGIRAFLDTHRDKLRGVFLINLESIGAGEPCMLSLEGERRVLKGDKRIMNLVRRVSGALHEEFGEVEAPYLATDAYRAMERSLRSLTIAGVEDGRIACSHTVDDLPYRVNAKNVNMVADVVTEVIRRS
ncbi:M28 family peptidase [uncultured Enorma sp.]|uniref:M28 family peptidase n=1 Tax=uncultured Enorma sp. TaxID=1714346 RepID=UPI00262FBDEB|nr:M28 family peptidase [uncultured Enorma sp.]